MSLFSYTYSVTLTPVPRGNESSNPAAMPSQPPIMPAIATQQPAPLPSVAIPQIPSTGESLEQRIYDLLFPFRVVDRHGYIDPDTPKKEERKLLILCGTQKHLFSLSL